MNNDLPLSLDKTLNNTSNAKNIMKSWIKKKKKGSTSLGDY